MGLASAGSGKNITLLWENSSPTVSFSAKKISLSLSGYDLVVCAAYNSATSLFCVPAVIADVNGGGGIILGSRDGRYRSFNADETGVTFSAGQDQSETANNVCIPYKLFGIKL